MNQVKLTSYNNSEVTFDIDNDGKLERTGWVSNQDGILAEDQNNNGKIDNITETISEYYKLQGSNWTKDAEGKYSNDGLATLKKLDSNNDGKFNNRDDKCFVHRSLRVFVLLVLTFWLFESEAYAACKASISLGSECKGEEGYIHIPKCYKRKPNNCGKKYPIFKGNKLPKMGSVVRSTEVLMFYQNLDEIDDRYKKCDSGTKTFKRKDLFSTSVKEAEEILTDICMTYFDKQMDDAGNDDVLGWSRYFRILSYEKINNDLFAKIKITK